MREESRRGERQRKKPLNQNSRKAPGTTSRVNSNEVAATTARTTIFPQRAMLHKLLLIGIPPLEELIVSGAVGPGRRRALLLKATPSQTKPAGRRPPDTRPPIAKPKMTTGRMVQKSRKNKGEKEVTEKKAE